MNHIFQAEAERGGAKARTGAVTRLRALAGGLVLVGAMTLSSAAQADDQDVIDYRRHIMKTMGEEAAIVGMILKQKAPADNFSTHVQILATTAATAKKAFEPKVAGGDAKPDVWAQWPDFAKRLDTLVAATDELAKAAQQGGVAAAGRKVQTALTCKGCHDNYRVPEK